MDLDTFKNTQGPIRERYAGDAKAALLTLRAKGTADESAVTCKVETGRGPALAGVGPDEVVRRQRRHRHAPAAGLRRCREALRSFVLCQNRDRRRSAAQCKGVRSRCRCNE